MDWKFDMNRDRAPEHQEHPAWGWVALVIILCVAVAAWLVGMRMTELTEAARGPDAVEVQKP